MTNRATKRFKADANSNSAPTGSFNNGGKVHSNQSHVTQRLMKTEGNECASLLDTSGNTMNFQQMSGQQQAQAPSSQENPCIETMV